MRSVTGAALPRPHGEVASWPGLLAAHAAQLGAREPLAEYDDVPAVPRSLVLQLASQFAPRRIADRSVEALLVRTAALRASAHVLHSQVLDDDRLVLADHRSGQLVQEVTPSISRARLDARDLEPGLLSVVGALLLARVGALGSGQRASISRSVSGIADLLASAQDRQVVQSHVDANSARRGVQRRELSDLLFDQHRDEPPARSIL